MKIFSIGLIWVKVLANVYLPQYETKDNWENCNGLGLSEIENDKTGCILQEYSCYKRLTKSTGDSLWQNIFIPHIHYLRFVLGNIEIRFVECSKNDGEMKSFPGTTGGQSSDKTWQTFFSSS
jgi:hypothetical protein